MNKIFEIQCNKSVRPAFKQDSIQTEKQLKTNSLPNDTFISETKQKKENSKTQTLLTTIGLTLLGLGSVALAKHLYKNAQNKLANGIKKEEIREEFFNFIKKNDPDCKYFNNKTNILQLEKDMDEEKFLILKKLYRMNDEYKDLTAKRFKFEELVKLLRVTDKSNIEFLELLATKQHKNDFGDITKLTAQEIENILMEINTGNKEVAKYVIDKFDLSKGSTNKTAAVEKILKAINKDNIEVYKFLFESRKEGNNTALNYDDLKDIANLIKEKNNPKTAEIILNLKKTNGSNEFVYTPENIKKILKVADDENIQTYEQVLNDINIAKLDNLAINLKNINENNCSEFIRFANLKTDQSTFALRDTDRILKFANITSNYNNEQRETLNKVFEKCKIEEYRTLDIEYIVNKISTADSTVLAKINSKLENGATKLSELKFQRYYDF